MRSIEMEKAAFVIYLLVLVVSPLLFGAVHSYAYTFMSLGVLTGTLLLVLSNIGRAPGTGVWVLRLPRTRLYIPFLVILAFLILQIIPLPDSLLALLSPEAHTAAQAATPAPALAGGGAALRTWSALAPYAYPVRMSVIRFAVYGLFFFGLVQMLSSRKRIETAVVLLLLTGCFDALYGILQTYSGDPHIWWYRIADHREAVTGTYINRNHFAGFMTMGMILAAAFSGALAADRKNAAPRAGGWRQRVGARLSSQDTVSKRVLVVFSGVVMGVGLIFSGSRGGMASAAGGLFCLSLLFVFKKGRRRNGALVLLLFAVTAAYALYMGAEEPMARFQNLEPSIADRARVAANTLDIFRDYRLFGTGVGNFRYVYPRYQSPESYPYLVEQAHNDWLQFLAEAGLVGFALMAAGVLWVLTLAFGAYRRNQDVFAVSLGASLPAVLCAVGVHAAIDFNLHIPANFLILAALLAIGFSALDRSAPRGDGMRGRPRHALPLFGPGGAALALLLALVLWSGTWSIRHFMAEAFCNSETNSTLNLDMDPPAERIAAAMTWDPWNAAYPYRLALNTIVPDPSVETPLIGIPPPINMSSLLHGDTADQIIPLLEKSLRRNPFEAQRHILLGWSYASLWESPDYGSKWLPAADLAMDRSAYFMLKRAPGDYEEMGNYWVMRSSTLHPADPGHRAAISRAAAHYRRAMDRPSEKARRSAAQTISAYVWIFYPDEALLRKFVELPAEDR